MIIHNKVYKVIMHQSTVNKTIKILVLPRFIGNDPVSYHYILRGIHPYCKMMSEVFIIGKFFLLLHNLLPPQVTHMSPLLCG